MSVRINEAIAAAKGLTQEERDTVSALVKEWDRHKTANRLHDLYYEAKVPLKNLGIAVPKRLQWVANACGWARLAVDYLVNRSQFDGFKVGDEDTANKLHSVVVSNDLICTYREAITSTLKHGCGFMTVTGGRPNTQDPDVVICAYPATAASAIWNPVERSLESGLCVVQLDNKNNPSWVNVFMTDRTLSIINDGGWRVRSRLEHSMGRPLIEPFIYKPTLEKPLGQSRISKPVRDLTDDYIRASARTEIAAELCAAPQKYALGVAEDAFQGKSKWDAALDAIFAVTRDENGAVPTFGQLAQGTMQPNVDYQRTLACRMSAETSIPLSALGVVTDMPTSAESIKVTKEDAIIEAQMINERANKALCNIALMALAHLNHTSFMQERAAAQDIEARFKNPALPSPTSEADEMIKHVSILPWLAESTVTLDKLGYTADEQIRMERDRKRYEAKQTRANLMARIGNNGTEQAGA